MDVLTPRTIAAVALALASCSGRSGIRIDQSDCAGVERYAHEQVEAVVVRYRATDVTSPTDLAALRALVDREMEDARTNWMNET
jgi:hypothetical protein